MDDRTRIKQLASRLAVDADLFYVMERDAQLGAFSTHAPWMLSQMKVAIDELETLLQVKPK